MANPLRQYDKASRALVRGIAVTPSDSADLPFTTRELRFAGAGNVKVTWADGSEGTHAVAAGERVEWAVTRIHATGTSATGIEAFR